MYFASRAIAARTELRPARWAAIRSAPLIGGTNSRPAGDRHQKASLDVDLHEITVSSQNLCDYVERMVSMLDEPLADPASLNVYFISKLAADHGVKVLLSGAGGDDLFTGYRRHQAIALEPIWRIMPSSFCQFLATLAGHGDQRHGFSRRVARLFELALGFRNATTPLNWRHSI